MNDRTDQAGIGLRVDGQPVAEYVVEPHLDPTLAPRPYLHPVRTLAGAVVTDVLPEDHRWHLGASLAVQDVSGTNLWGGRTYVRDLGYTWRDDHGRIEHVEMLAQSADRVCQRLRWCDRDGGTLLDELRELAARPLPGRPDAWVLDFSYTLTAPAGRDITLGSPATNGRPGGAGYGGFFWRAAPGDEPPQVYTASLTGEESVNGSTDPWVALSSAAPHPYTLVFVGLAPGTHWFVRSRMYPGVCAAFAYERPLQICGDLSITGNHSVVVADAVLAPRTVGRLASMVTP